MTYWRYKKLITTNLLEIETLRDRIFSVHYGTERNPVFLLYLDK